MHQVLQGTLRLHMCQEFYDFELVARNFSIAPIHTLEILNCKKNPP